MNEREVSATHLQRNWGAISMDVLGGETVRVLDHGRPALVILSAREYEGLLEAKRAWEWMQTEAGASRTDD
jgi:PHD/YefM family antitoxin component YafN of YafNO toxin-antitoxin module